MGAESTGKFKIVQKGYNMLARNKSGWMLLEYLKIEENEMDEIILWDLIQDIGYVDECDLKILELSCL